MNEKEFKTHYVASFLASYAASHFDDHCMSGWQNNPHHNQPVEDAVFLSDLAWDQLYEKCLEK